MSSVMLVLRRGTVSCWTISFLLVGALTIGAVAEDKAVTKPKPNDRAVKVDLDAKVVNTDLAPAKDTDAKAVSVPTHHQVTKLQVNAPEYPQARVSCFCLSKDGMILAGCTSDKGEIRLLDAEGKLVKSWPLPVKPEAIYSRDDGVVFVAGDGQVLKLSSSGDVELAKAAPHASALNEHPEKLREEVIAQAKMRAEQFGRQAEVYDKMIAQADKQIEAINEQVSALDKESNDVAAEKSEDDPGNDTAKKPIIPKRTALNKTLLERRLTMYKRQREQYEQMKKQFAEIMGGNTTGELTEEQIDQHVKATMEYKLKASSISAVDNDVYLATHATTGYGFDVWRMDDRFENPNTVVTNLRGCCGQMDVKADKDGLFVAENAEHRVCHFDRDGNSIGKWGESARTGIEGFGSCCNPMNVTIGPGNVVYTAEDNTGRIKRYSTEGKLLGLVGSVELKPGCKNCSIAVSSDGNRVYMLDITRNFIAQLDARPASEIAADIEKMKTAPAESSPPADGNSNEASAESASASGGVIGSLLRLFSSE